MKAEQILEATAAMFPGKVTFASSLGAEDQVLLDMIYRQSLQIPVFTLDTGRLFQETYDLIAETERRYGIKIKLFFPDCIKLEKMVSERGVNLFYKSIKDRKYCCEVRKLQPLRRALAPYSAWVCGLRKSQSENRGRIDMADWDAAHDMIKINPLAEWSEKDIWAYIESNRVPYNKLHKKGFPSIGCRCCTRAVEPGESIRAGRWWWEQENQKECGLHFIDGKIFRSKDLTADKKRILKVH